MYTKRDRKQGAPHPPHDDSFEHVGSPACPIFSIPTMALACCVHKSLPAPPEDVCPRVVLAWNMALAADMELTAPAAFAGPVDLSSSRRRNDLIDWQVTTRERRKEEG